MASILDYVSWIGYVPFSSFAFNEVDALILNTLSYIHFDELLPGSIKELAEKFLVISPEEARKNFKVRTEEDCDLLKRMAASRRFSSLVITDGRNIFSKEEEIQFSAITIRLAESEYYIAYRGTDNTMVGWKEDFNMAFSAEVPAQREALSYLEEMAARYPDAHFIVGGHSKGGNIAVYASAKAERNVQSRIDAVYNNDGPGFLPQFLDTEGYGLICPRIHTYVPQSSVIGMLLDRKEEKTVINSSQMGVFQHDPYSWQVEGDHFERQPALKAGAELLDQSVKAWLASIPSEERSRFVDTIFSYVQSADITRARELRNPKNLLALINSLKDSDKQTREMLLHITSAFIGVYADNLLGKEK